MRQFLKGTALAVVAVLAMGSAMAQEYPNRVVRLVIPYPPGGSAEQQARILAQ